MKCDDCFNLLEEYVDGEIAEREAEQISFHLTACTRCAAELEALTAESEIYARYDREIEVSPAMWQAIAARSGIETRAVEGSRPTWGEKLAALFTLPRLGFAVPAMAGVVIAVIAGAMYLKTQPTTQPNKVAQVSGSESQTPLRPNSPEIKVPVPVQDKGTAPVNNPVNRKNEDRANYVAAVHKPVIPKGPDFSLADQSDVLDVRPSDIEDKETANHVEQAQNLLRSIRNLQAADDDDEVDVSYEKAMSRRLLDENVVLRRDAEMAGNFPAKRLLSDLEPFLIDIANLPAKTTPADLRVIKDRVQKTEIVAALQSY
jgi:hypothetical protein